VLEISFVAVDDLINELLALVKGADIEMTQIQRFGIMFDSKLNLIDIIDGEKIGYKTVTEDQATLAMRLIRERV
jgi:hypothetical protein